MLFAVSEGAIRVVRSFRGRYSSAARRGRKQGSQSRRDPSPAEQGTGTTRRRNAATGARPEVEREGDREDRKG